MADGVKISALPNQLAGVGVAGSDLIPIVDTSAVETKRLRADNLAIGIFTVTPEDIPSPASEDRLLLHDVSGLTAGGITIRNAASAIMVAPAEALTGAAAAAVDELLIYDLSGVSAKTISLTELANAVARQLQCGISPASAAALGDVTNAVNTTGKYLGKILCDVTSFTLYFANGSAATDVWKSLSGGSDITPA